MTLKDIWDIAISIDIIPIIDGMTYVGGLVLVIIVGAAIIGWLLGRYKGE